MNEWPEKDEIKLRELWNVKCFTASQIADILGYSRNAIIGKARRMKLNTRTDPSYKVSKPRKLIKVKKENVVFKKPEPEFIPFHAKLEDMESGFCYYITRDKPFGYCGHKARGTYCDHHLKIMRPKK